MLVDDADGSAARAYGLTFFPYTVLVGAYGAVLGRVTGALEIEPFIEIVDQMAG